MKIEPSTCAACRAGSVKSVAQLAAVWPERCSSFARASVAPRVSCARDAESARRLTQNTDG